MRWYDRDGRPHDDPVELGRLTADDAYRVVGRTKVMDTADSSSFYEVSTVWLGIDHQHIPDGPPLIFETAVFRDGSSSDITHQRYSTLHEAEHGHHEHTTAVAATLVNPVVLDWTTTESRAPEA